MTEEFRPALLVSMPQLQDPNFARTVILLCEFNQDDGAFGLVINRPTDVPAVEMIQMAPPLAKGNELRLWIGGPVDQQRGWILVADAPEVEEFRTIREGLYLSTSPTVLRTVLETRPAPRARVLAGYAGWAPGQLDEEIAQSAWLMSRIDLDVVFDTDPSLMWETVIRRLGADPSVLTTSHGVH